MWCGSGLHVVLADLTAVILVVFLVAQRQSADVPYGTSPARATLPEAPAGGLTEAFPDTPIVVMYGSWIEYHGPYAEDFADIAGASFYTRFGSRLSSYTYPQDTVLSAYLAQVSDVPYAGLFDQPLPYQPVDPLRITLPALPWLFAVCVVAFLALSVRSLLRVPATVRRSGPRHNGIPVRLAGLTALAVEVSGLTDARTDPALIRASTTLQAARAALDEQLPDRHIRALLDAAESELDQAGRGVEMPGYRPAAYLQGRLA